MRESERTESVAVLWCGVASSSCLRLAEPLSVSPAETNKPHHTLISLSLSLNNINTVGLSDWSNHWLPSQYSPPPSLPSDINLSLALLSFR